MKHLTITLLTLLMSFLSFANSVAEEEEEEFKSILDEVKKDMSYTSSELKKMKQLFQEEYLTIGLPGINKIRFSDLTIHESMAGLHDKEMMIISTSSARVPGGNWMLSKPHIYLIEKDNSGDWEIVIKKEITGRYNALYGSCRTNDIGLRLCTDHSLQYFKPKVYGRSQPYVFQNYVLGGTGSYWSLYYFEYNKYAREYNLNYDSLSFPVIPNPDPDLFLTK